MNIVTRRLLAVAATGALVSAPAVAFVGTADPANAASIAGTAPRAGIVCRTATPAGLFDGLLDVLTGSGSSGTDPLEEVIDQVQAILDTAAADPTQAAADIADVLGTLPDSGGGEPLDLAALTDEIAALLQGGIPDAADLVDTLTTALALPPELMALFPAGLPDAVTALLSGDVPTSPEGLVSELAAALGGMGETTVPDDLTAALDGTPLLDQLRDALDGDGTTGPGTPPGTDPGTDPGTGSDTGSGTGSGAPPVSQPGTSSVSHPTAHPPAGCTTPATTTRCRHAKAKKKALHHRLKVAKKRHHHAKVKVLKKKLAKAKKAKRHAC